MSVLRFKVPKDSIPIVEKYCIENYPKSFEAALVRHLYVLDYIVRGCYRHRKIVPLSRNMLSERLGISRVNASKVINGLLGLELIKKEKSHIPTQKSSCYSITDTSDIIMSIPFQVFDHMATRNIIKRKNERKSDSVIKFESTLEFEKLAKYLSSISIQDSLILSIINHPLFPFLLLPPYGGQHLDVKEEIEEFKAEFSNVVSIYNKDLFIKRKDNKGRVYTNFSVMDRCHRPYLHYEGQVMKCLDIANSQPLIFCAFLKKYCEANSIELPEQEYELYKKLVENGMFYERFMEGDETLPENRVDFKKSFFGSVFYTKVSNIPYPLRKRFVKVFPKIYGIMDDIKTNHGNKGFALLMQEEEARIIWDCVNAPMLREGYLCYNIYDSIVSHNMETIKEAERRLKLEFNRIGISPTFKLEVFE